MSDVSAPYDVYVFHRSYFCGKMLAYLRYKEIPHRAIYRDLSDIGSTLDRNLGLRQLPAIKTPDGRWMNDTTPMIEWFEQQYPDNPVLPYDPINGFLCRLLEDYADEWLWRPAILSRWESRVDRTLYQSMFVKEFLGGFWASNSITRCIAGLLVRKHQNDKFLYGDGMTRRNRDHVWSIYSDTLNRLETIFQEQAYLLGDKPCMADFGFFGSMFWHFGNDPTPNRIMQETAPAVYEWVARLWNLKAAKVNGRSFDIEEGRAPQNWQPLLADVCKNYLPYLLQNAEAFANGEMRMDCEFDGYAYPGVHVSPYRVWCRERLQNHLMALSESDRSQVQSILQPLGGWEALQKKTSKASGYDSEYMAPFCEPGVIPFSHKIKSRFSGSNHIRSTRAWKK